MLLGLFSAFVLSPTASRRVQASLQGVFAPVAWPVNRLAGWVHSLIAGRELRDDASPGRPRGSDELIAENHRLRVALANAQGQLQRLQELEADRARLGDVRKLCTPVSVIGVDSGPGDSLMLGASSLDNLRADQPVLCADGVVGRISRAGVGGAQALLVTDPQSKLEVTFARMVMDPDGQVSFHRLMKEAVLFQGTGRGSLTGRITEKIVQEIGLQLNDWAVLSDRDWPMSLEGYKVGRVVRIAPAHDPGFVEVEIRPDRDLMRLQEVMVMNKQQW